MMNLKHELFRVERVYSVEFIDSKLNYDFTDCGIAAVKPSTVVNSFEMLIPNYPKADHTKVLDGFCDEQIGWERVIVHITDCGKVTLTIETMDKYQKPYCVAKYSEHQHTYECMLDDSEEGICFGRGVEIMRGSDDRGGIMGARKNHKVTDLKCEIIGNGDDEEIFIGLMYDFYIDNELWGHAHYGLFAVVAKS